MENFEIISWPDIQEYMMQPDFFKNVSLIEPNDNIGIGSSTYLVSKKWLDKIEKGGSL